MVFPSHNDVGPVIIEGIGFTVMDLVTKHPVGRVYVNVVDPMPTPVTNPVIESILAMPLFAELHLPPADVLVTVIVDLKQTKVGPPMLAGNGLTVTVVVMKQPAGKVYVIVAVVGATKVTNPVVAFTVATAVLLDVHVPPETLSRSVDV
jgi:hypothetical protein